MGKHNYTATFPPLRGTTSKSREDLIDTFLSVDAMTSPIQTFLKIITASCPTSVFVRVFILIFVFTFVFVFEFVFVFSEVYAVVFVFEFVLVLVFVIALAF